MRWIWQVMQSNPARKPRMETRCHSATLSRSKRQPPNSLALALLDPDEHPVTIDIGELERYDLRGSQAGGISQAQDRSVLNVRRRGEQPTDLLRAQNNGQAARLAGRDELLGKIVAFQCDLEEEPQGSGADVGGSHRRPARGQP